MVQCSARSKHSGGQCRRAAMHNKAVCWMHGGTAGRPPTHGRYSKALKSHPELLASYEEMHDDPEIEETKGEIAVLRAYLAEYLEEFGPTLHPKALEVINGFSESISRLVDRRHKQQHGESIVVTIKHLEAFVAQALDTARRVFGGDSAEYRTYVEELSRLYRTAGSGS